MQDPKTFARGEPMIPETKNGLNAMTYVSAMQKAIRRGIGARFPT